MGRAVVIRLSSLGDVVLASAVVEALSRAKWEIAFLTRPQYAPLYRTDPRIAKLIEFHSLKQAVREIKSFDPSHVVDLQVNQRTFAITACAGRPVIRTPKRNFQRRLCVWFGIGDKTPRSVVDDHLAAVESGLGVVSSGILPGIYPSPAGLVRAEALLSKLPAPIAAIHPGAKHPLKRWGEHRFRALAKILAERGFSVLFIDDDTYEDDFFHTGKISLEVLVGLLDRVSLFVGNDSGPTHVAAALGTPTVAIFGPTHPCLGFVPRGEYATYVYSRVECSPCTLHGEGKCKFGSRKCFEEITPEMVAGVGTELYEKFIAKKNSAGDKV